jgi:hypothetical protein
MVADKGDTWDLSDNDRAALKVALTALASSPPPAAAERGLRERVEGAVDRIENLLGALAIPMPDRLQVKGIRESLPSIRDDLRAALREEETR